MNPTQRSPLRRSTTDRMIAGVCGGIAAAWNLDPAIVRLIAVLIGLSSAGTMLLVYLILAIVMPVDGREAGEALGRQRQEPPVAADAAEAPRLPSLEPGAGLSDPMAFTPDEIRRWDLPGAAKVVAEAGADSAQTGPSSQAN